MRQIRTIPIRFPEETLNDVLGEPSWDWEDTEDAAPACGLASGKMRTAGWGNSAACCRIWVHVDGICIGTGLDIPEDHAYAEKVYQKLLSV